MHMFEPACVYTCLIGRYECLSRQPMAARSSIPFVCLTDDAELSSSDWSIRQIEPEFADDPVRSQRLLKLLPHRHLPKFAVSLYIDNSVILSTPPEDILDRCLAESDFALPTHSFRRTVQDEFTMVTKHALDDPLTLSNQLAHYLATDPEVLRERPYWTGIMARRHGSAAAREALEAWAEQVMRFSRRDQLSSNYAFRRVGFQPKRLDIDNYASAFHSWPHAFGRNEALRSFRAPPPMAWLRRPLRRLLARAMSRLWKRA